MRRIMRLTIAGAALLAPVMFLSGCEDTPLSAGKDYTMTLIAQPQTVVVNPAVGIDSAQASILATVLNADSVPQQGITVYFSNKGGGSLTSGVNGVKTNSSGIAADTLTVTADDPAEIDVIATSAALTATIKVTKSTVGVNNPPTAEISVTPATSQATGQSVIFDGSGSSDPDEGGSITMYKWVITSTNPDDGEDNPIIVEGPGVSDVAFPSGALTAFVNVQNLTVTLLVTDDPNAPAIYAAGQPVAYRAQQTVPYSITAVRCSDNTKPTAVIAGAAIQSLFGAAQSLQTLHADGTLSHDAETAIQSYTWNCGNGSEPTLVGDGSKAECAYVVDQTARTYTLTLVVSDRGTGLPVGGPYDCVEQSTAASIQVVVSPTSGG
jgi:hypothetical protein